MDLYTGVFLPAYLIGCGLLLIAGVVTLIWVRAHRALKWVVTAFWILTGVHTIAVIGVLLSGDAGVVLTLGYLLAGVALLPLLGIGRLGEPEAGKHDPGRPVLMPDQIARVDGGAAVIIAITAAALAWRVYQIVNLA